MNTFSTSLEASESRPKAVAIITARGGSKRIPHKNVRDFCGKPIISYSLRAALASGVFDEVMVSTDEKAIADVAREYGACVPCFWPMKAAGSISNVFAAFTPPLPLLRPKN